MAAERDAYEVLQVDPKANEVVLKAAHHALASLYHTDVDQAGSASLDFGRYRGWTLAQLAREDREDPDYVQWLSRHSSGLRYRSEIGRLRREQSTQRPTGFRPGKPSTLRRGLVAHRGPRSHGGPGCAPVYCRGQQHR